MLEGNYKILKGFNIDVLKQYPDNYFDSVVTDPPYGLGKEPNAHEMLQAWLTTGYLKVKGKGFMGNEWDSFVPQPLFWKEVYRVLKHGGHVVSFFGTRTYDWGVMAMRLSGFEIRDGLAWVYGNGFPKSHNICKAIDKMGGESLDWFIDYILKVAEEKGISKKELTMLFPSKNGKPTGWLWNKQNNQSITLEQYNTIKDFLKLPFDSIKEAERQVIGVGKAGLTKGTIANFAGNTEFDITAPSTDAAKKWDGYGTALKPAFEPIVLARKPLEEGLNIAENILKWGTGGLNIDGCRIGNEISNGRFPANFLMTHHPECECLGMKKVKGSSCSPDDVGKGRDGNFSNGIYGEKSSKITVSHTDENGEETVEDWRCHPDCPVNVLDKQSGVSTSVGGTGELSKVSNGVINWKPSNTGGFGDIGGASRFFYVAKASKSERNFGLKGEGSLNNHPTVKPIKLMQYLVRLVTPPNGKVLDPFNGSGTTGIGCVLEGFEYHGIDEVAEFCEISESRIKAWNEIDEYEHYKIIIERGGDEEDKQYGTQGNLFD